MLDAIIERVPPPAGDPRRAAARARLRLRVRPVPRRARVRPRRRRLVLAPRGAADDGDGHALRRGGARLLLADDDARRVALRRRGRLRRHRAEGRLAPARRRHAHVGRAPCDRSRCPGYKDVKPMVFAGLFPTDSDDYPELRDALERLKLNDARALLRAGDVEGARLRLPLRLPRPAAHGDRPRAPRARVRPRPARHRADRRVPRARRRTTRVARGAQPGRVPARVRGGRGAVREGVDHRPEGVRRRRDGAQQRAPRHVRPHGVPLARARPPDVRAAARARSCSTTTTS